jgi:uncharacterized radical SAM superfamily protein
MRLLKMMWESKVKSKTVPTLVELESLTEALADMRCPHCSVKMVWRTVEGNRGQVVSLQHDHSGRHRLLCQSCNAKHRAIPNDGFYTLPKDHLYCPGCRSIKHSEYFSVSVKETKGRKSRCKACDVEASKEYRALNRHKRNAKERQRYHLKKNHKKA